MPNLERNNFFSSIQGSVKFLSSKNVHGYNIRYGGAYIALRTKDGHAHNIIIILCIPEWFHFSLEPLTLFNHRIVLHQEVLQPLLQLKDPVLIQLAGALLQRLHFKKKAVPIVTIIQILKSWPIVDLLWCLHSLICIEVYIILCT